MSYTYWKTDIHRMSDARIKQHIATLMRRDKLTCLFWGDDLQPRIAALNAELASRRAIYAGRTAVG